MTSHAFQRWTASRASLLSRAISEAPNPDPNPACPTATPRSTVDQICSCLTTGASLGAGHHDVATPPRHVLRSPPEPAPTDVVRADVLDDVEAEPGQVGDQLVGVEVAEPRLAQRADPLGPPRVRRLGAAGQLVDGVGVVERHRGA